MSAGSVMCGKQMVPLDVWLMGGTKLRLNRVTPSPMPRLMYVCAHGCVGLKATAPPSIGQSVRLVAAVLLIPPPFFLVRLAHSLTHGGRNIQG